MKNHLVPCLFALLNIMPSSKQLAWLSILLTASNDAARFPMVKMKLA